MRGRDLKVISLWWTVSAAFFLPFFWRLPDGAAEYSYSNPRPVVTTVLFVGHIFRLLTFSRFLFLCHSWVLLPHGAAEYSYSNPRPVGGTVVSLQVIGLCFQLYRLLWICRMLVFVFFS